MFSHLFKFKLSFDREMFSFLAHLVSSCRTKEYALFFPLELVLSFLITRVDYKFMQGRAMARIMQSQHCFCGVLIKIGLLDKSDKRLP